MSGTIETIYVDVGGGTTDVGFFRFEKTEQQPQERAIYLDSIQYAGDDVWNAIIKGNLSEWELTKFEREARAHGSVAIFDDLGAFRSQRRNMDESKGGLQKFVDGLVEYIARMIAAREHSRTENEKLDGNLGLYLLGNGWRFIEILSESEEEDVGELVAKGVKDMVEKRLKFYKDKGILKNVPSLTVIYPIGVDRDPKTVVALGAMSLYVGEKVGHILPEPEFEMKSFLGSDLAVFTPMVQVIEWYKSIPYELSQNTVVRALNYQRRTDFNFESEQIDGQLEQIKLIDYNLLARRRGRTYINKNIFALYLEEWHKQLLLRRPTDP